MRKSVVYSPGFEPANSSEQIGLPVSIAFGFLGVLMPLTCVESQCSPVPSKARQRHRWFRSFPALSRCAAQVLWYDIRVLLCDMSFFAARTLRSLKEPTSHLYSIYYRAYGYIPVVTYAFFFGFFRSQTSRRAEACWSFPPSYYV
ncbi:hypothetical protein CC78DRAFT_35932 [Lojkania enalia]|uniref:Uncharacterized protein n=1 Tax=Lojkania enalia TaxID=147567 RepID=A0A9P4KF91_9PLEO|nr:hypothetical protein CC78DRAFT_35932 [Didymosphaeria enalia]